MADKLIRVNSSVYVMASDVRSVRYVDSLRVEVGTSGDRYLLEIDYGKTAGHAMDRFIVDVNKALQNNH
ncbi:hypothetical protein RI049_21520 [Cedecea neteri]|uniref:hypothetical protein n=1 Tax=Cedecea neteri TaxID=158822 RepID=UPI002AA75AA5|nr:hypothetical protein [Cedecea neteri]WPU22578.1 hypothetical protein RI049_21520 [Cedecea neteri]